MSTSSSLYPAVRRTLAVAAFAGAGVVLAGAQTGEPASQNAAAPANVQTLNLQSAAVPFFSSNPGAPVLSSSSSLSEGYDPGQAAQTQLASLEKSFLPPGDHMQYGQRRRYGAPRYRGGNTNADGSEKYTGFAGAGLTAPIGNDSNYLNTSYSFQVGAGRNFNKNYGLNLQFDWDNFGLTGPTLVEYSTVFLGDPTNTEYGLDGHSHIWSITLNPIYNIRSGEGLGAYVVAGGGFYHKEATFTIPEQGVGFDPFYGEYEYEANVPIQNYSSNSAGVNGGFGLTYKFSRFANERLYGEVRIVHTFNTYKPGITTSTPTATADAYTGWNYFPQNSQETTYFPIKFGIRF